MYYYRFVIDYPYDGHAEKVLTHDQEFSEQQFKQMVVKATTRALLADKSCGYRFKQSYNASLEDLVEQLCECFGFKTIKLTHSVSLQDNVDYHHLLAPCRDEQYLRRLSITAIETLFQYLQLVFRLQNESLNCLKAYFLEGRANKKAFKEAYGMFNDRLKGYRSRFRKGLARARRDPSIFKEFLVEQSMHEIDKSVREGKKFCDGAIEGQELVPALESLGLLTSEEIKKGLDQQ